MQPRINWPGICEDWATSGLSKQRYFLSTRIERFVRCGALPGYSDVIQHLNDYEKEVTATGKLSAHASAVETAIVHHLSAREMRAALSAADACCDSAEVNNHVTLKLANGTTIEFEAENAERFALQAISLGRLA